MINSLRQSGFPIPTTWEIILYVGPISDEMYIPSTSESAPDTLDFVISSFCPLRVTCLYSILRLAVGFASLAIAFPKAVTRENSGITYAGNQCRAILKDLQGITEPNCGRSHALVSTKRTCMSTLPPSSEPRFVAPSQSYLAPQLKDYTLII